MVYYSFCGSVENVRGFAIKSLEVFLPDFNSFLVIVCFELRFVGRFPTTDFIFIDPIFMAYDRLLYGL